MTARSIVILVLGACLAGWLALGSTATITPYQVGAGVGVLSWLTFYFSNKPIGASSFYANTAGLIGKALAPKHTGELKYYQDHPPQTLHWESIFLLAAILGGALGAWSAGDFHGRWLSPMWERRFGQDTYFLRFLVAFGGGILMAFGARLAGGCTSGHGISGTLQLSLASWLMVISLFIGGILTAQWMYGGWL